MQVNEDDDAFMQRILLITFAPLNTAGVDTSKTANNNAQWTAMKEAVSCLLPDFASLLVHGKLDKEAIADCCNFVNECSGVLYNRNCNLWGFLLYYLVLLTFLAQGVVEDFENIFEYVCNLAVRQNYVTTKHSSIIDQFILALEKCRQAFSASADNRNSIHWHNFRTECKPEGYLELSPLNFYAIRLDHVLLVISNVLKVKFKRADIIRAVEECDFAHFSRAKFYDLDNNEFPINKTFYDEQTSCQTTVPLPEKELLETQVARQRALFFRAKEFDAVWQDVDGLGGKELKDYKTIIIKSVSPHAGSYNFYDAVMHGWFGYRAVGYSTFAPFCGATNAILHLRDDTGSMFISGMEQMHRDGNWRTPLATFDPREILMHYGYEDFPDDNSLPPCFRINPFQYRNSDGDCEMPDDPRSKHYHAGLLDDFDAGDPYNTAHSPKKPRRTELRSGETSPVGYRASPGSILQETPPSRTNKGSDGGARQVKRNQRRARFSDGITHTRRAPHPLAPRHPKRYSTWKRPWYMPADEGEDLMDDDGEEVCPVAMSPSLLLSPKLAFCRREKTNSKRTASSSPTTAARTTTITPTASAGTTTIARTTKIRTTTRHLSSSGYRSRSVSQRRHAKFSKIACSRYGPISSRTTEQDFGSCSRALWIRSYHQITTTTKTTSALQTRRPKTRPGVPVSQSTGSTTDSGATAFFTIFMAGHLSAST